MGKYIEVNGISDVVELLFVHDCSFMPYLSLTDCTKYYMCIKLSYTIYVEYDYCMCSEPLNAKCYSLHVWKFLMAEFFYKTYNKSFRNTIRESSSLDPDQV